MIGSHEEQWEGFGRKVSWSNQSTITICLDEVNERIRNLNQDIWCATNIQTRHPLNTSTDHYQYTIPLIDTLSITDSMEVLNVKLKEINEDEH